MPRLRKASHVKKAGRPAVQQRRLGKKERAQVNKVLAAIRAFGISAAEAASNETVLNARLIAYLQNLVPEVTNSGIAAAHLVGETFRPECCIKKRAGAAYNLLAVECKRLLNERTSGTTTIKRAKILFKEGLSQALIYQRIYKVVVLVLYDFTAHRIFKKAFRAGNRSETQLAGSLRRTLGVRIIVLSP